MTQLEFWQEKAGRAIANVPLHDVAAIPAVGDLVYIPDVKDSGVYAYVEVRSRRFYYSQQGELTVIRLTCEPA
jgi:hypothetical protein